MKSTALILLLCIYSLSTFGVSAKQFYCCGELKSVTLALVQEGDALNDDENGGCCETKIQTFKVKDKHLQSAEALFPAKLLPHPVPIFISSYPVPALLAGDFVSYRSHAPPIYSGVAIYISNRVFRI